MALSFFNLEFFRPWVFWKRSKKAWFRRQILYLLEISQYYCSAVSNSLKWSQMVDVTTTACTIIFHFLLIPRWTDLWCPSMVGLLAKPWPQTGHLWGFSPVWTFMWSFNKCEAIKLLGHNVHLKVLLSMVEWAIPICLFRCRLAPDHPHSAHVAFWWLILMWTRTASGCLIM